MISFFDYEKDKEPFSAFHADIILTAFYGAVESQLYKPAIYILYRDIFESMKEYIRKSLKSGMIYAGRIDFHEELEKEMLELPQLLFDENGNRIREIIYKERKSYPCYRYNIIYQFAYGIPIYEIDLYTKTVEPDRWYINHRKYTGDAELQTYERPPLRFIRTL